MIRYNACDLSRLIKKTYKREFSVPSMIMEDQKRVEASANKDCVEDKTLINNFFEGQRIEYRVVHQLFEDLMNDLCDRGLLEEGEYLLCFDD